MPYPVWEIDQILILTRGHCAGRAGRIEKGDATIVTGRRISCKPDYCPGCRGYTVSLHNVDDNNEDPEWCSTAFRSPTSKDDEALRKLFPNFERSME